MLDGVIVGNHPLMGVDPWGLSWCSVALGTTSAVLSTASLATVWNPVASTYLKAAGAVVGVASVANAYYEYKTGEISRTVLAITACTEAVNMVGGFASKPVEAFVYGVTR